MVSILKAAGMPADWKRQAERMERAVNKNVLGRRENFFEVGIENKATGEKTKLIVRGENVRDATHRLTGSLFGSNAMYRWIGSGPHYE